MKNFYIATILLLSVPLSQAAGIPCAGCGFVEAHMTEVIKGDADETPVPVQLDTPIFKNTVTPKEIRLTSPESKCTYYGVLTSSPSEDKNSLIINVHKRACDARAENVSYSVLHIKSDEDYGRGAPLRLYHAAVMTASGPLFSAGVFSDIIKDTAGTTDQQQSIKADHDGIKGTVN